jgi:hypothetical protein
MSDDLHDIREHTPATQASGAFLFTLIRDRVKIVLHSQKQDSRPKGDKPGIRGVKHISPTIPLYDSGQIRCPANKLHR